MLGLASPTGLYSCLGLRTVYDPPGSTASVDIILVHGLQGHATRTWTKKAKSRPFLQAFLVSRQNSAAKANDSHSIDTGPADEASMVTSTATDDNEDVDFFWPKDLLPQKCPEARILTWGYDTKVSKFGRGATNKNTVFSHAKDLLYELSRLPSPSSPLIFVAHSFGGILVKEMLSISDVSDEPTSKAIVKRTAAVVFLGTPHRGSVDLAKLGNKARKIVSAALIDTSSTTLDALGLRTPDLERCQDAFSRLWARYDFQVKTFQEGLGLSGFNIGSLNDKVVPGFSSLLGDARERAETLQANHMDMCRFSGPGDPNAQKVLGELQNLYQSILRVKKVAEVAPPRDILPVEAELSSIEKGIEKACLRSLRFQDMHQRRQSIQLPFPGTCNWLFEHPKFQAWHEGRQGAQNVILIHGKPACGKSVLMREAEQRLSRTGGEVAVHLSFFFDSKGTELQRNWEGACRSLLHQLLSLPDQKTSLKRAISRYTERLDFEGGYQQSTGFWRINDLQFIIRETLLDRCREEPDFNVRIFIDALDECSDGHAMEINSFIRFLTHASASVKVCISARSSYPGLSYWTSFPMVAVEEHNQPDILHYLKAKRIGVEPGTDEAVGMSQEMELLRDDIRDMSCGIFLWVVLVVDMVLRYIHQGRNLKFIREQLQKVVPEDLDQLFRNLLRSPAEDPFLTRRVFYWASLGGELRIQEWRHILAFIRPPAPESLAACNESEYYAETDDQVEKQLRHISMGLIEVAHPIQTTQREHGSDTKSSINAGAGSLDLETGESRVVRLIHGSVREFFLRNNGFECLGLSFSPVVDGYLSILNTCLDYITVTELDDLVLAREKTMPSRMPSLGSLRAPSHKNGPVAYDWEGIRVMPATSRRASSGGSFCSASSLRYAKSLTELEPANKTATAAARSGLSGPIGRGGVSPLSNDGLQKQQHAATPSAINFVREYLSRPQDDIVSNYAESTGLALGSIKTTSVNSSWGFESRVLQDHPALLSYVLTTFFYHIRSAQKHGGDLTPIWRRLENGMWERWSCLRGDVPRSVSLEEWARKERVTYHPST
ncbi:hypothetical protein QBC47DRAFT_175972 [Echria macrotheca]|uniref:Nephrocystin 3-like N-terminal domain-containing protein n=1 Tax=Echria macrotheca TaxID=438768 RepID=A0AAJ0BH99_9PEZI|nr:hypothetical protein QBC47DRAFT_175972 [Echria macrotheca]